MSINSFVVSKADSPTSSRLPVVDQKYALAAFILAIMTIPSRAYRLPVQLPFDLEIYRLVGATMLIAWIALLLIDPNERWRRTSLDGAILFFLSVTYISLLANLVEFQTSEEFDTAIKAVFFLATYFLVFYLTVSILRTREDIISVLKFIVWLGGVVSVFAVFERVSGYNFFKHLHEFFPVLQPYLIGDQMIRGGVRVSGSVAHPIAFSAILAMIAPLAFYFVQSTKERFAQFVYGALLMLIMISVVLTGSRTGFLGIGSASLVFFWGVPELRRKLVVGSLVILLLIHMLFPGALSTLRTYLSPVFIEQDEVGNQAGRLEDYPKIWAEFQTRPLLGRSFGTFDPQRFFFVDNQFLKFVVETGVLGAIGFLFLLLTIFRCFWRSAKEPEMEQDKMLMVSLMAVVSVFAISCLTFDTFGFSQVPYLFLILVGIGIAQILNTSSNSTLSGSVL